MKTSSCKAKARLLQNKVRDRFLEEYPELLPLDVKSAVMGESGEDIKLSPAALEKIPYGLELKNYEKIAVYKFFKQAKSHVKKIQKDIPTIEIKPLVVVKQNNSDPLAILDFEEFLRLLKLANLAKNLLTSSQS